MERALSLLGGSERSGMLVHSGGRGTNPGGGKCSSEGSSGKLGTEV
jgi:hypothetical protein